MFGVIGQYVGAEHHFSARLADALSHLQRCQPREVIHVGAQQRCGLTEHGRTFHKAHVFPALEITLGLGQRQLKLRVCEVFEALQHTAVVRVHALVGHGTVQVSGCGAQAASPTYFRCRAALF